MLLLSLFLFTSAYAGDAPPRASSSPLFEGLTVTKTYPKVKITHYSATPDGGRNCRYEGGIGGRDESPTGFKPLSHRLDKPGPIYGRPAILTALPQEGGTHGAYRCYFALPDAYPGKLFFGGDVYGPDSNGLFKTDVSSPCTSVVNETKYSKMIVYDCGSRAAKVGPLYKQNRIVKPSPPAPPKPVDPPPSEEPAGACPWYSVAACAHEEDAFEEDLEELGDAFQVVHTDSIPTFAKGWHCLVTPSADRETATAKVRVLKRKYSSAYVKKGC